MRNLAKFAKLGKVIYWVSIIFFVKHWQKFRKYSGKYYENFPKKFYEILVNNSAWNSYKFYVDYTKNLSEILGNFWKNMKTCYQKFDETV